MSSATGARDDGTRLIEMQNIIAKIQQARGPDPQQQLELLEKVRMATKSRLESLPGTAEYLADVADLITTKHRHLADA